MQRWPMIAGPSCAPDGLPNQAHRTICHDAVRFSPASCQTRTARLTLQAGSVQMCVQLYLYIVYPNDSGSLALQAPKLIPLERS